jgi:hypothetical protein
MANRRVKGVAKSTKVSGSIVEVTANSITDRMVVTIHDVTLINNKNYTYYKLDVEDAIELFAIYVSKEVAETFEKKGIKFLEVLKKGERHVLDVDVHRKGETSYVKDGIVHVHTSDGIWLYNIATLGEHTAHNMKVMKIADSSKLSGIERAEFLMKHLKD